MVRILKVKDLEDRKRRLLTQSELYRQTLRLELANVKYSAALLKRRYSSVRSLFRFGGLAPLLGGILFARKFFRKRKQEQGPAAGGLLAKLLAGWQLFGRLRPILSSFAGGRRTAAERETTTESR